jgi:signal transduction histidine kinase
MARHLRRTLSAEAASNAVSALAAWYVVALAGTLLVAGAVGWLLAQRALAPVEEMTRFARRISEERLGERLAPAGPPDELRELGETLDAMLDRLADAFDAQRRFLANASHELRTPLAVIRTEAEVALANPEPDVEELREVAVAVSESVVRTEALLDGLMLLARSQPGLLRPEPLELAEIARRVARQTSTEARSRDIDVRVGGDAAHTTGDRALVERLVANLVENGVRHNVPGGWVDVATGTDGDDAVVAVRNSGPVVAPEHIDRLTAPFERLGRHGDAPGAGLGLSIVQAVADAHGATLVIEPRPDGGLDVSVRFGRDPWAGSRRARGGAST